METNPYQSPQAECAAVEVIDESTAVRRIRSAISLYRWMGYGGMVFYALAAIGMATRWGLREGDLTLGDLVGAGMYAAFIALFAASVAVGNRLATRPVGVLWRTRLIAIALGVAVFPWLTIPAVICVRNVTRYLDAYCRWMEKNPKVKILAPLRYRLTSLP